MYTIEKDGWKFIIPLVLLGLIFLIPLKIIWPLGVLCLVLAVAVAAFFRQPRINRTFAADEIVAPTSGTVINIREIEETEFLKEKVLKLSIFMSVLNEHINYAPLAGEVAYLSHKPGKFKQAFREEASQNNESQKIGFHVAGRSWMMKQIAGAVARRIVCRCRIGDQLQTGQKLGMIRFGSRVELFFPLSAKFTAVVGDRVQGGRTVLGKIK